MEANLFHHEIKIYDGLKRPLKNWANHIVNIVKRCKLADREADFKFTLEPGSIFREMFKLSFDSGMEEDMREGTFWFVWNDLKSQQNDTYNCGPIACMKVMELYDCSEFKIIDHSMSGTVHWYRSIVMDKFKQLVRKFNDELTVSLRVDLLDVISPSKDNSAHETKVPKEIPEDLDCFCYDHHDKMEIIAMACCRKKVHKTCLEKLLENFARCAYCKALIDPKKAFIDVVCLKPKSNRLDAEIEINESKSLNHATDKMSNRRLSDSIRHGAMEKKRLHQAQSHERMKRWRIQDIGKMNVSPGTVVTIQVDSRDVSHPQGIMGVVIASKKDTGAVLVVCASGMICTTDKKVDYWVPIDRYSVKATAADDCVLAPDLKMIRMKILSGDFDRSMCERTTIQKAHQVIVGASSPCARRACRCKGGKCTPRCGCRGRKPPLKCHSGCACNGNCAESDSDGE
jgi:hypothetical protein